MTVTSLIFCMETEEGLLELVPFVLPNLDEVHQNSNTVKLEGALCCSKKSLDLLAGVESDDTKRCICQRFLEECVVQSKLRHPNILQFIGVYRRESPFDTIMVMEHMHTNLDLCLRTHPSFPLFDKVSVLLDVSAGLRYLHSRNPPVAHRELTARNVFLSPDVRAKIGDLGVLTILDSSMSHIAAWEKATESLPYVAPEARKQFTQRSLKADVYSLGVLALYTATQVCPTTADPVAAREEGDDSRTDRKGKWLNMVGKEHSLYEIINKCIDEAPDSRPTTDEISKRLKALLAQLEASGSRRTMLDIIPQTKNHENVSQKGVSTELKRVAKLQTELVEARTQIRQIEGALKEVKSQLEIRQKSEQETLDKVYKEMEVKDKEIQMYKIQLEELKTECSKMKESKVPPPIPDRPALSNNNISDLPSLPTKPLATPTEVSLRPPGKSQSNRQRNSTYKIEEEPQTYEEPVESLNNCPWFYSNLDVMSAEARLHAKNWTGAYLVRESTSMKGQYTLSLLYNCDVRHMRIVELHAKKYTLDNATCFSSVRSMIQHYHSHPIYLETGGRTILKDEN